MKESEIEKPTATTVEDSDELLAKEWDSLDWERIEQQVGRMQRKISKAVMNGNLNDEKLRSHHQHRPFSNGLMMA